MTKTTKKVDEATGVETTGHEWDGIEELNNPLPRWWLWTFYATIVWGVAYTIAYPAWPMISGATEGVLGFSTRGVLVDELTANEERNAQLVAALNGAELTELSPQDDLHRYAVNRGAAVFRANCSQCHGSGAAGATGYPNLLDDNWLWGGSVEEIAYTIDHGIRNETDPEARWSQMPAFGEMLSRGEIASTMTRPSPPRARRSSWTTAPPATAMTRWETARSAPRTSRMRSGSTAATARR